MIACDWQIAGAHVVEPFDMERVNPASIDLCLGDGAYDLMNAHTIGGDVLRLIPGVVVLVTTLETVTLPDYYAGQLVLKSSMGRRGVSMPAAGWVDPGFSGTLTVQLSACVPVVLTVGQPFIQMILHRMAGVPDKLYQGKYQGQQGVTLERQEDITAEVIEKYQERVAGK